MGILTGIYNEEILQDIVRKEGKEYLIPHIIELNIKNTLPNLVVKTIEEYSNKCKVLTMDKLMSRVKEKGYSSRPIVGNTLSILRDYLALVIIEDSKIIRLSTNTDFEKGGYFYVPEKVVNHDILAMFDKDILKYMVLRDDRLYLIPIIESLDKENTVPNMIIQIIEEYDNKGLVLTSQKLSERLAEKGYKTTGIVDSTLIVLRDYLRIIVSGGPAKNRIIRLILPTHIKGITIEEIEKTVIIELKNLFYKFGLIPERIDIIHDQNMANVYIGINSVGIYDVVNIDTIVDKIKNLKEESIKNKVIKNLMLGNLNKGVWTIMVYFDTVYR